MIDVFRSYWLSSLLAAALVSIPIMQGCPTYRQHPARRAFLSSLYSLTDFFLKFKGTAAVVTITIRFAGGHHSKENMNMRTTFDNDFCHNRWGKTECILW